jgi:hypothetical protein
MRLFNIFGPPATMINVGKSGLNFLFSVIHTTLNWGQGGIYAVVSVIFAPDCHYLYFEWNVIRSYWFNLALAVGLSYHM